MTISGRYPIVLGSIHKHHCALLADKAAREILYISAPLVAISCDPFGKVCVERAWRDEATGRVMSNALDRDLVCTVKTDTVLSEIAEMVQTSLEATVAERAHG